MMLLNLVKLTVRLTITAHLCLSGCCELELQHMDWLSTRFSLGEPEAAPPLQDIPM